MAEGVKNHKLKQRASNQERKHREFKKIQEKTERKFWVKERTLLLNLCITKDWLIYTYQYLFILEVTDQKEEEKRGKTSNKL